MSCSNCCSKYGFFLKEHGCPACGRSVCSRCLPEKLPVPALGGKLTPVCRRCYNAATTLEEEAPQLLPPEALSRRLEGLEDMCRPPVTVYRQSTRAVTLKRGLSQADCELVDRLEALRADRRVKHAPTEQEMAERLAALRSETAPLAPSTASNLPPAETRSAAEQEAALLAQARDEVGIAARHRPEAGLSQRLAQLRGLSTEQEASPPAESAVPASTDQQTADDLLSAACMEVQTETERANQLASRVSALHSRLEECSGATPAGPSAELDTADPSEDEQVQMLIKEVQERARLEEKELDQELDQELESSASEGEQLPWCIICSEDAALRCPECFGDIYCLRCYFAAHHDDLQPHKPSRFPDQ